MNKRVLLAACLFASQASAQSADEEDSLMRRLTGQFEHSDIESPDLDVSAAPYVDIALKFRPSLEY